MTFAIKGGGVSSAIGGFQQKIVWKPVKILPGLLKRFAHNLNFIKPARWER